VLFGHGLELWRGFQGGQLVVEGGAGSLGGQDGILLLGRRVNGYRLPFDVRVPDVFTLGLIQTSQIGLGTHEGAIHIGGLYKDVLVGVLGGQEFGIAIPQPFSQVVVVLLTKL